MKIKKIKAREILDSRGNPTLEVLVNLQDGSYGKGMVPSGASTGVHEALELRDGDKKRHHGKGVLKACENVNSKIAEELIGKDASDQSEIDKVMIELDGTENKVSLGANAILGVSMAVFNAVCKSKKVEPFEYIGEIFNGKKVKKEDYIMPYAFMNIINGGQHADSGLDIQEYMIVPQADRFSERIRQGAEVFHTLKDILKSKGLETTVGDEGGFAPRLETNEQALEVIVEAIKKTGLEPGKDVKLAIDAAASEFYKKDQNMYFLSLQERTISSDQLIALYREWVEKYPFISVEDPLAEDDFEGWQKMMKKLGDKVQVIGDDLFVTNIKRLEIGIDKKLANSVLIKPNQIGSITETINCIQKAFKAGFKVMVSHRSGETCDTFIADLAVGTNAGQIKTGSLSRGERVAKYNRLMEIEEMLD